MERRKLLQALSALPATILHFAGKEVGRSYAIESSKKYLVFVDPSTVDLDAFSQYCDCFPKGTPIHCVAVPGSLDDAIRIYEIDNEQ